jgi:hypothetical protein
MNVTNRGRVVQIAVKSQKNASKKFEQIQKTKLQNQ